LLITCKKEEDPDDLTKLNDNLTVVACGCGCDEPIEEFIWHKELIWDYPVKPGMEEWKKFQSTQEMIDACQIPKKILSSLSTSDLTDICFQYPLLLDVFAFRKMDDGIDKLFDDFNGIRELFTRKEVSKELLKRYHEMMRNVSFLCRDTPDIDINKGFFVIYASVLEFLLRSTIRNNDKIVNYKIIMKYLVFGYETKLKYEIYFGHTGFITNFYSRAHLIVKINPQSIDKFPVIPGYEKNPIFDCEYQTKETQDVINELSYMLIK